MPESLDQRPPAIGHLERIRLAELEPLRHHFGAGLRVLELGGGSGYQARLLHSWGCDVTSIDLADRHPEPERYYPVESYDGRQIPFRSQTFDLVFSSNVLEHVDGLPDLCREMRRVLRDDGRAIHIVPTAAWRLWTSLAHYVYLWKRLFGHSEIACAVKVPSGRDIARTRGIGYLLRRVLWAGPHGSYPTAAAELYYYSRRRWLRVFRVAGLEPVSNGVTGVFHTGYALLPRLSMVARRRVASVLGSACHVFVLRRPRD